MFKAIVAVVGLAGATLVGAQDRPLPPLDAFLASARAHLQTDRKLLSQYTYLLRTRDITLTKTGKIEQGPEKLFQVYPGLRYQDTYRRLIEVNGTPRDPADLAKDDQKHQKKVLDEFAKREHESTRNREKRLRDDAKDAREDGESIEDLFRIYDFTLVERQTIDGVAAIVIDFAPKPGVAAKTDDGKIMKKTKGRAWVSEDDYEIARVDVEMLDDLSFGLFIAKLYKGTTLRFDRRKVNGEVWLPAQMRLSLAGRALVRKFKLDTVVQYSDYRKFSVETDTTFKVPK